MGRMWEAKLEWGATRQRKRPVLERSAETSPEGRGTETGALLAMRRVLGVDDRKQNRTKQTKRPFQQSNGGRSQIVTKPEWKGTVKQGKGRSGGKGRVRTKT